MKTKTMRSTIIVAVTLLAVAIGVGSETVPSLSEDQAGDVNLSSEHLSISNEVNDEIVDFNSRPSLGPRVDRPKLALQTLQVAKTQVGFNRGKNREQITQYLNLYGLDFVDNDKNLVPFCAAGVGFSACLAYRELTHQDTDLTEDDIAIKFRDSLTDVKRDFCYTDPRCASVMAAAKAAGVWVARDDGHGVLIIPQPGWLVLYSWNGGPTPQHVGIVESASQGKPLQTIEFNTSDTNVSNGGAVAARNRDYNHVLGYVDTYSEPKNR
jgi:hypothetical protein